MLGLFDLEMLMILINLGLLNGYYIRGMRRCYHLREIL